MENKVKHNEDQSFFEIEVDGERGVVNYRKRGNTLLVLHTGVPKKISGRGVAAVLTKALVEYAKANGLKVEPFCPYTKAYLQKHTEYQDIVV